MSELAAKSRWQLNQEAFDKLLSVLAEKREEAGEKYLLLRKNLVRFFETRSLLSSDDLADEVINRLAKKLESGEVLENPNIYAIGIARMVVLETRKKPLEIDELPEISVLPENEEQNEKEEKLKCLENCLQTLPSENRQIIVGYYQGEKRSKIENRQKLANNLGIPQNALRNRAVRLRDKLEGCITSCLREKKLL